MTGSEARFIEAKHRAMDEYTKSYIRLMKIRLELANGQEAAETENFYSGYVDGLYSTLYNVFLMKDEEVKVLDDQAEQFFNDNYMNKGE